MNPNSSSIPHVTCDVRYNDVTVRYTARHMDVSVDPSGAYVLTITCDAVTAEELPVQARREELPVQARREAYEATEVKEPDRALRHIRIRSDK